MCACIFFIVMISAISLNVFYPNCQCPDSSKRYIYCSHHILLRNHRQRRCQMLLRERSGNMKYHHTSSAILAAKQSKNMDHTFIHSIFTCTHCLCPLSVSNAQSLCNVFHQCFTDKLLEMITQFHSKWSRKSPIYLSG